MIRFILKVCYYQSKPKKILNWGVQFISLSKKTIASFVSELRDIFKKNFILLVYSILALFLVSNFDKVKYIFSNPESNIPIVISILVGSATLTILTFNYASVLNYPNNVKVTKIGKLLLISTLLFMIGIVFIAVSMETTINLFRLPENIFNIMGGISFLVLYLTGFFSLMISGIFFSMGIARLLHHLIG